jgi:hypothetical protein
MTCPGPEESHIELNQGFEYHKIPEIISPNNFNINVGGHRGQLRNKIRQTINVNSSGGIKLCS